MTQPNFYLFKFIVYILFSIGLIYVFRRIPCNYYLVLLGYLLGSYLDDAIQIRNTISLCFLLLSYFLIFRFHY